MGKLVRIQIWKAGGASVTYDRKVKGKRKNRRLNVATRNKEDKIGVWESICEKLDQHELVVMIHQVFASCTHFQRVCFCGRINPTSQLSKLFWKLVYHLWQRFEICCCQMHAKPTWSLVCEKNIAPPAKGNLNVARMVDAATILQLILRFKGKDRHFGARPIPA